MKRREGAAERYDKQAAALKVHYELLNTTQADLLAGMQAAARNPGGANGGTAAHRQPESATESVLSAPKSSPEAHAPPSVASVPPQEQQPLEEKEGSVGGVVPAGGSATDGSATAAATPPRPAAAATAATATAAAAAPETAVAPPETEAETTSKRKRESENPERHLDHHLLPLLRHDGLAGGGIAAANDGNDHDAAPPPAVYGGGVHTALVAPAAQPAAQAVAITPTLPADELAQLTWAPDEEARFSAALAEHGCDWARVARAVRTRSAAHVALHARTHFLRSSSSSLDSLDGSSLDGGGGGGGGGGGAGAR